ncbi:MULTISPECIES: helix-turn-helix transcriptional regulator [unclassified Streptomyces]|uniref:helix-turn-helix domain-containing protein n=1 Tax=unclassified Streptomyces TaxID=2593676 RepID=UPI001BE99A06|nr:MULTISPECIES: helix-turn-helix transcriptional regulator [unclassified Streptomyces]MBT2403631.1 helix-turn-helix domain-containing protein [Streptomyces sp. ISL-21]MBT2609830.1 helix-turn-helix domain-containing protein [Streptomyces sp. ISL-87]
MNTDGADESSWELDPEDESGAVIATVGRQLKMWREASGLDRSKFGERMGYGPNLIYKIERGARIPRPEFLDKADEVLGAGGKIAVMKTDIDRARYPKKVRDLAKLESEAVELGAYGNHNLHGLLQTEEYTRALYEMRRPAYSPDEVERYVAARMARQEIFHRQPSPALTFVLEQVTLERTIGGRDILRRQLERLLDLSQLRNVEIQVMPTDSEDHAGMGGHLQVVKLRDGSAVGYVEAQLPSRLITSANDIQLLELRYGIIRSQALSPRQSRAFIEKVLGET